MFVFVVKIAGWLAARAHCHVRLFHRFHCIITHLIWPVRTRMGWREGPANKQHCFKWRGEWPIHLGNRAEAQAKGIHTWCEQSKKRQKATEHADVEQTPNAKKRLKDFKQYSGRNSQELKLHFVAYLVKVSLFCYSFCMRLVCAGEFEKSI